MILPIVAYGHPVLRRVADPLPADYPGLRELIDNMWETLYNAHGVGLAAPQVGLPIRLFLVDSRQLEGEDRPEGGGIKRAFLNAVVLDEVGEPWSYEEGCLSIPDIREKIIRPARIRLRWQDEQFAGHEETFEGLNARIIQHEYDHTEGVLFTDLLGPLKKRLLRKRLDRISRGRVEVPYRMKFPVR